ncbi:MAG: hypothetical protein K0U37_06040 [Gammaproteobacteria bacterium]|nr:hypothetical protein [Gammaproteobacteria bacterium]
MTVSAKELKRTILDNVCTFYKAYLSVSHATVTSRYNPFTASSVLDMRVEEAFAECINAVNELTALQKEDITRAFDRTFNDISPLNLTQRFYPREEDFQEKTNAFINHFGSALDKILTDETVLLEQHPGAIRVPAPLMIEPALSMS